MAPALGPSHRFIVKGDIVNDLLKGIGNVVNPKRVFRELTDFKPGGVCPDRGHAVGAVGVILRVQRFSAAG